MNIVNIFVSSLRSLSVCFVIEGLLVFLYVVSIYPPETQVARFSTSIMRAEQLRETNIERVL